MNLSDVNATMNEGLEDYSQAREKVKHCLNAYKHHCQRLIEEIGTNSRTDAEEKFDILFDISGRLSKAWFVLGIDIGTELKTAVREFERLHEQHIRDYWFKRFQAGVRWPAKSRGQILS